MRYLLLAVSVTLILIIEVREWTFLGLVYNLNFRGFFLEPGLTFGEGDYSNPQGALQIGYMHRFLP